MTTQKVIVTHTDKNEKGLICLNVNAEDAKHLTPGKEYDLTETEIEALEHAQTIIGKPKRDALGRELISVDPSGAGPSAQDWEPQARFNIKYVADGNIDKKIKAENDALRSKIKELEAGKVVNEVRNQRGNNRKGAV